MFNKVKVNTDKKLRFKCFQRTNQYFVSNTIEIPMSVSLPEGVINVDELLNFIIRENYTVY